MKCPSCGEEVSGKFCNNCGASLQTEPLSDAGEKSSGYPERNTTYKTRKQKKKGNALASVGSKAGSAAGSAVSGTVKTVLKLLFLALQWICCGLMALGTWLMFSEFWKNRTVLGSFQSVTKNHNYAQGIFLILGFCLILFGILETFWILGRSRIPDHGKIRRVDMGHGTFAFAVFALLSLAAPFVKPLVPSDPTPLLGIIQVLLVFTALGSKFLTVHVIGFALCLVRKFGTR